MKETEKKISEKVINLEELSKRGHSEVGEMLDIFKKDVHQESALNIYKHFHYGELSVDQFQIYCLKSNPNFGDENRGGLLPHL